MFRLIMRNTKDKNWEFNDTYDDFDQVIERISKTLKVWKKEIPQTTIYNLQPFEIKIYNLKEDSDG